MINNYQYFIVLAEELNISKAAKRLFISHQCLSKYLKKLEQAYNTTFFERSPRLSLTQAGRIYLDTLLEIQLLEDNLSSQLQDISLSQKGCIRFGTTEGRYRILIPSLLTDFKRIYPEVQFFAHYDTSGNLCDHIMKNKLDIALMNKRNISANQFESETVLNESLYMVISDHLLEQYFPNQYPSCKEAFKSGIDLSLCQKIPFILNHPGFNSRDLLESHLNAHGIKLNCVLEMTQQDLHFMLAAKDYAACFCWAMYIPSIQMSNRNQSGTHLNVFPIKGLKKSNQIVLIMPKGKILPAYGRDLIGLIKRKCNDFSTSPAL